MFGSLYSLTGAPSKVYIVEAPTAKAILQYDSGTVQTRLDRALWEAEQLSHLTHRLVPPVKKKNDLPIKLGQSSDEVANLIDIFLSNSGLLRIQVTRAGASLGALPIGPHEGQRVAAAAGERGTTLVTGDGVHPRV
jgi:hypothetical protein